MLTMRCARTAAQYYRERDPHSAISETYIRRLIDNGDVPSVKNGCKKLTAIEWLDAYFEKQGGDV